MVVKIILRNHLQQKQVNAFPVDIQCLRYGQFDGTENKRDVYRGENCMKKIFESQRACNEAIKINNFGKKKLILLISKEYETYLS